MTATGRIRSKYNVGSIVRVLIGARVIMALHNDLTGRDAADCHDIAAITDLQSTLDTMQAAIDAAQTAGEVNAAIDAALVSINASIATLTTNIAAKVAKAGDTMTGALVLSGAPTLGNHAATKTYVDDAITSVAGADDSHILELEAFA
jgi:hypothetical protein